MITITENQYKAMDASKQVNLTMIEIKEIVYQLEKVIEKMEADATRETADESGIQNEKLMMLEQIIKKLQS
jgi:hypothetical protein